MIFSALVSHKYKFVYVPVHKSGSTTMLNVLQRLHGGSAKVEMVHTVIFEEKGDLLFPENSLAAIYVQDQYLEVFTNYFSEYRWFSVVRDPVERTISLYNNKLNLFARRYCKGRYVLGELFKAVAYLSGKSARQSLFKALQSNIRFSYFVETLAERGTDFDVHFLPQSKILRLRDLKYDRFLKLEQIDSQVRNYLKEIGVAAGDLDQLDDLPRLNFSEKYQPKIDQKILNDIRRIYQRDYDAFEYDS